MGTRADFYVGRGESAEWLGSIAWDGYPDGVDLPVRAAKDEAAYRAAVAAFLDKREDATLPADGWPWPWENSLTTDFSYAFDDGRVYGTCFGNGWWPADEPMPEDEDDVKPKSCVFPNMKTDKSAPAGDRRSGIIVFGI